MMNGLSMTIGRAMRGPRVVSCLERVTRSLGQRKSIAMKSMARESTLTRHASLLHFLRPQSVQALDANHRLMFHSEAEFHPVADETLDAIQDAMEELFEEQLESSDDFEANCAAGVLTISLPPHGTWVINKQTPNRQLWWSSPLSGPRRYEYEDGQWVFTRSMDSGEVPITLGDTLVEEIRELYDVELEIDI